MYWKAFHRPFKNAGPLLIIRKTSSPSPVEWLYEEVVLHPGLQTVEDVAVGSTLGQADGSKLLVTTLGGTVPNWDNISVKEQII